MNGKRLWGMSAGLWFVVACAEGTTLGTGSSSGAGNNGEGGANGSSSSGNGGNDPSGTGGMMGTGGTAANSGGAGGSGGSGGGTASSSSSSSSGGTTCPGVVVDWNWNTGTGPTNLSYGGNSWSIGAATEGPKDGLTYLATVPDGNYADNVDDWAQLPTIDLSTHQNCQFRTTVELWRNTERVGVLYDGSNLQYTIDPAAGSGWTVLDSAGMNYDGKLSDCGSGCIVEGQKTWASSDNPKSKTGIYQGSMPGTSVTFRFTFHSDNGNDVGRLPGVYVKRLLVEAF